MTKEASSSLAMNSTFAQQAIAFHQSLQPNIVLPNDVEWIYTYNNPETLALFSTFMNTYYADNHKRYFVFGINPGRHGSGLTGIPFTDPIFLDSTFHIKNDIEKKHELSSLFFHEMLSEFGVNKFFTHFYVTATSPLGLVRHHKNYNYYDDHETQKAIQPFIINSINKQVTFGAKPEAFCIGQGKNLQFLQLLNQKHQWFTRIIPLPHPRWIMQYRRTRKNEYIDEYIASFTRVINNK